MGFILAAQCNSNTGIRREEEMLRTLTGHIALAALALLALSACTAPSERVSEAPGRNDVAGQPGSPAAIQSISPVGRPYLQVANVGGAAGTDGAPGFGPMAGSFALADGAIVYRHVAPGGPAITGGPVNDLRLSYFKVGPDGAVQDWATASVPASQSACPFYAGGSFRHCTDFAARQQTFDAFDPAVRTSVGAPLAAWGARRPDQFPATAAVPSLAPAASSLPLYPGANPDADAAYTN